MTQEEIQKNNELIAGLMIDNINYRIHQLFKDSYKYFQKYNNEFDTWTTMSHSKGKGEEPRYFYHFDWSWLMLVVEKIESLVIDEVDVCVEIIGEFCTINGNFKPIYSLTPGLTKLQAVYKVVIEFIKFYNDKKRQETKRD